MQENKMQNAQFNFIQGLSCFAFEAPLRTGTLMCDSSGKSVIFFVCANGLCVLFDVLERREIMRNLLLPAAGNALHCIEFVPERIILQLKSGHILILSALTLQQVGSTLLLPGFDGFLQLPLLPNQKQQLLYVRCIEEQENCLAVCEPLYENVSHTLNSQPVAAIAVSGNVVNQLACFCTPQATFIFLAVEGDSIQVYGTSLLDNAALLPSQKGYVYNLKVITQYKEAQRLEVLFCGDFAHIHSVLFDLNSQRFFRTDKVQFLQYALPQDSAQTQQARHLLARDKEIFACTLSHEFIIFSRKKRNILVRVPSPHQEGAINFFLNQLGPAAVDLILSGGEDGKLAVTDFQMLKKKRVQNTLK